MMRSFAVLEFCRSLLGHLLFGYDETVVFPAAALRHQQEALSRHVAAGT